jgi:hypothetical protein
MPPGPHNDKYVLCRKLLLGTRPIWFEININAVRFTGLSLWRRWCGKGGEAVCLLPFPLLLRLAFAFPGIVVKTQGFVDCVFCEGGAC